MTKDELTKALGRANADLATLQTAHKATHALLDQCVAGILRMNDAKWPERCATLEAELRIKKNQGFTPAPVTHATCSECGDGFETADMYPVGERGVETETIGWLCPGCVNKLDTAAWRKLAT